MGKNSAIEWCDNTFNPWIGCSKVAPGCTHCYAEAFAKRYDKAAWGPKGTRVRTSAAYWREPLKWNKRAAAEGTRPRVFCASLADVFEDWDGPMLNSGVRYNPVPVKFGEQTVGYRAMRMDDVRMDLFALIDATPNLDWLLLTKRPENIHRMWPSRLLCEAPHPAGGQITTRSRPNVWLLTSVATQQDANRNIPELLKCRDLVPVLGISAEPLVGPIDLRSDLPPLPADDEHEQCTCCGRRYEIGHRCHGHIDWIIVGGESGPNARPCNIEWIRSLVVQGMDARVPVFVKQLGAKPYRCIGHDRAAAAGPGDAPDCYGDAGFGCQVYAFDSRKGHDPQEWPSDLRVREYPQPTEASL